jgi:hypothetical protein
MWTPLFLGYAALQCGGHSQVLPRNLLPCTIGVEEEVKEATSKKEAAKSACFFLDEGTASCRNIGELLLGYKESNDRREYGNLHDTYLDIL